MEGKDNNDNEQASRNEQNEEEPELWARVGGQEFRVDLKARDRDEDKEGQEPHTRESCLKRVRRVMEHQSGPVKDRDIPEMEELAEILFEGPAPRATLAEESGETFAVEVKAGVKFLPYKITYHLHAKSFTAYFKTTGEDAREFIVSFGKFDMKEAQHAAEERSWNYYNILNGERRMLHREGSQETPVVATAVMPGEKVYHFVQGK
jgi:hypothetical protein